MNKEKINKFIKLAVESGVDCQFCKKIGLDVQKCDGDCIKNIMELLEIKE